MNVLEAAKLMEAVYQAKPTQSGDQSISLGNVQAHYVSAEKALVIEGTNEPEDWVLYNFNLFFSMAPTQGDSRSWYHAGFMNHARIVFGWAKMFADKIDVVIGHSLGAASAQIVGPSLKIKTVAFASPRPLLRGAALNPEFVINYNREDDLVCYVPPGIADGLFGYTHIGAVEWMKPAGRNPGEDHRIDKYINILKDEYPALGQRQI